MKSILFLVFTLSVSLAANAHALWIETNGTGEIGKEQAIRIYYGEYSYDVIETVGNDAFKKVENFKLWVVEPSGKKSALVVSKKEDHFLAKYTPKAAGVYTIALDNNDIEVIDYTQYDFGIFKTHYQSLSKFTVGESNRPTVLPENKGLFIQDVTDQPGDEVSLKVFYQGEVLVETEVEVAISGNWTKTVYTDENGIAHFTMPWSTKYFIEVTKKEEVPGQFKGEEYEFIWHCATYMVIH